MGKGMCKDIFCMFFDTKKERNCSYGEDNPTCVKNNMVNVVKPQLCDVSKDVKNEDNEMAEPIEPDKIICPKCGAEEDDFDGFGFQYCKICGNCIHPNSSPENGVEICGVCGREIERKVSF